MSFRLNKQLEESDSQFLNIETKNELKASNARSLVHRHLEWVVLAFIVHIA